MGGQLWRLDIPLTGPTMIVGMDVYHNTTQTGKQSVVGFCATYDKSFTKYYSLTTFQKQGQELVDGLHICMTEALKFFFKTWKSLPDRVIVYRDGVGDGMLGAVADHELPQFKTTFNALDVGMGVKYQPKFAFIVVKKRIHTRLFQKSGNNPPPGTIVDTGCVHHSWYDFFLVSQSVTQGTVTPTHYHILEDTTGLQPDHIQMLTYKMCHLYYNWPGTIRVPAPCQNAHKLAFLVGQSIHQDPNPELRDKLHFL